MPDRPAAPKAASPAPDHPGFPAAAAAAAGTPEALEEQLVRCRACPRLVAWRQEAGRVRREAFREWTYWSRPVPGFGPPEAPLLISGLAPAAHGANRTGRMFTGDRSGEFLYAALYELGLASQPTALSRDDGLRLRGVRITSPVHCAPPGNRPTPAERDTCLPWLARELGLLPGVRAVVALGGFGWQAVLTALGGAGWQVPRPRPAFGHGARLTLRRAEGRERSGGAQAAGGAGGATRAGGAREAAGARDEAGAGSPGGGSPAGEARALTVFGCYHVSQRNVFTGRLTPAMFRAVLAEAAAAAGLPVPGGARPADASRPRETEDGGSGQERR
ncbi:uracil-DNA glycosylase [Streptomyces hoynatensis]|uniref:Type-5 uracil-DNA glycosylase n=1 Tax=Streptomyces hoynatensis TaxID=1141874 RepID=A0A3A9YVH8_9ACTN|nr:uracil-DNA glycosylase [Streptomyces hoynatensis]RKN40121.1 uracil-DNA glycosylase [Streptomyces hoynatensis]